jgi:hypothetical protein
VHRARSTHPRSSVSSDEYLAPQPLPKVPRTRSVTRRVSSDRQLLKTLVGSGFVLALVASTSTAVLPPGHVPAALAVASPFDSLTPELGSVYLTVNNSAVAVGSPVYIWLNLTGVDCATGAPRDQFVTQLVFLLGDGFVFQEPLSSSPLCMGQNSTEAIPLVYLYNSAGADPVSAVVNFEDGHNVTSNVVIVTVTSTAGVVAFL